MGPAAAIVRPPHAAPPQIGARVADRSRLIGRRRGVVLWAALLCLVAAAHAAVGAFWLTRRLPVLGGLQSSEPVFELDLAEPAAAGTAAPIAPVEPTSQVETAPMVEPPPDIPAPQMPATTDQAGVPAEPAAPAALPPEPDPPGPLPPETTPPPRKAEAPASRPSPAEQARERLRERERAEARREAAEERRRQAARHSRDSGARQADRPSRLAPGPSSPTSGASRASGASQASGAPRAPSAAAASGASAAASAAWRNQIVGILRGRFAGGARGMASVSFSVSRGGQIAGARLTASSGDARLDAAALAAFRGAVPAPPAGYVGPLTFNIRLGVR